MLLRSFSREKVDATIFLPIRKRGIVGGETTFLPLQQIRPFRMRRICCWRSSVGRAAVLTAGRRFNSSRQLQLFACGERRPEACAENFVEIFKRLGEGQ